MANCKIFLLALAILLGACASYDSVTVHRSDNALVLNGVIDSETAHTLRAAMSANPAVRKLVLQNIPGSADDEHSLRVLSRYIRGSGLTTVVPANGLVASGGTDMVTMGRYRVIEPGACIGVHSWAMQGLMTMDAGADLPRDDAGHDLYLDFYQDMGIVEEFYWFTLQAAGPDKVHWMTEEEINRYGLSTEPVQGSPHETAAQRQRRCESRISQ